MNLAGGENDGIWKTLRDIDPRHIPSDSGGVIRLRWGSWVGRVGEKWVVWGTPHFRPAKPPAELCCKWGDGPPKRPKIGYSGSTNWSHDNDYFGGSINWSGCLDLPI